MTNPPGDSAPRLPGSLAIVGSGPSSLFLLNHLLAAPPSSLPSSITIFEKNAEAGVGMPYSPRTTDCHHLSNISSDEIPLLVEPFADWLRRASVQQLEAWSIQRDAISPSAIYPRLALGAYFRDQYRLITDLLRKRDVVILEKVNTSVSDLSSHSDGHTVVTGPEGGEQFTFDSLVIATGHQWPGDDLPAAGYVASPWPISKILPPRGEFYNFEIGILGASLSAFDVVTSLAHHHGEFQPEGGKLAYILHPAAEGMKFILHSADGQLPHLLFEQTEPMREIYRHTTRERIEELIDPDGFLPLATYFDEICRPVLVEGFTLDHRVDVASHLESVDFTLRDLVRKLAAEHDFEDPFDGMASELAEAEELSRTGRPTHWKEYLDDLFYTLNFHSEFLSAEDHQLLKGEILPFVMSVVAAMPLDSARKLLALRAAGVVDLRDGKAEVASHDADEGVTRVTIEVDDGGGTTEETFKIFVHCAGQHPSEPESHPFPSLFEGGIAAPALARFRDPTEAAKIDDETEVAMTDAGSMLKLGGLDFDSSYRLRAPQGEAAQTLFDLALPDVSGLRPYSYGLQAASEAAAIVAARLLADPRDTVIRHSLPSPSSAYEDGPSQP